MVNADFSLYDRTGKKLLSQSYREYDDKIMDSYRHAAHDFMKKSKKVIEESMKIQKLFDKK